MRRCVIMLAALGGLAGCSPRPRAPDLDGQARALFDAARHRQNDLLLPQIDPQIRCKDTPAALADMERLLPYDDPLRRNVLSTHKWIDAAGLNAELVDEYEFPDGREVLVRLQLRRVPGQTQYLVDTFRTVTETAAELAVNDFTLAGKNAAQYSFLVMMLGALWTSLAGVLVVSRRRGLRRRYLWIAASLLSVGNLQMNWATGGVAFTLWWVQPLGVAATRGVSHFAPWILSVSFPVPALLIIAGILARPGGWRRRKPASGAARPTL